MSTDSSSTSTPNPFDPESLKLTADYSEKVGARKVIKKIATKKPHKQSWFMASSDPEYSLDVLLFQLSESLGGSSDETYLVAPEAHQYIGDDGFAARLLLCITRQNDLFLWPLRLPDPDGGRPLDWHTTALSASEDAKREWIKVVANRRTSSYDVFLKGTETKVPDPVWPTMPMAEILKLAFADCLIDSEDHKVIKLLNGDA